MPCTRGHHRTAAPGPLRSTAQHTAQHKQQRDENGACANAAIHVRQCLIYPKLAASKHHRTCTLLGHHHEQRPLPPALIRHGNDCSLEHLERTAHTARTVHIARTAHTAHTATHAVLAFGRGRTSPVSRQAQPGPSATWRKGEPHRSSDSTQSV